MCKIWTLSSLHFAIEYHVERERERERIWTKDGQVDLWICVIVLDGKGIPSFKDAKKSLHMRGGH